MQYFYTILSQIVQVNKMYSKTLVPEFLKVSSIISIFRTERNWSEAESSGEAHSFHEFVFVENGDFNILVDGELFSLRKGQLIIYEPHSFHSVATSRDAAINVVCFETSSNKLPRFSNNIITANEFQQKRISELVSLSESLLEPAPYGKFEGGMTLRDGVEEFAVQRLANLLELLLIDLYETDNADTSDGKLSRKSPDSEFLNDLVEYMRTHIEENLTISDISKACSLSVSSLHRLCKRQCGCGPISLFISIKLGEAKRLIAQGRLNFTEISQALGFSSVHYFSKLFKQKTGMTPSRYAKSIRGRQTESRL